MVSPGDVVAIVGAGPIGLAAILTATLYTPGRIVAIDLADSRLDGALRFGADTTINNGSENAYTRVMELTDSLGADVAFEAVGVPQTFELAAELIRPCGRVANIGVHGKPVTLHLETLWTRDVTITTGLVDTYTIPRLMKLVASGRLDPTIFATHRFKLGDTMSAYDTFADAASTNALKVVLEGSPRDQERQRSRRRDSRSGSRMNHWHRLARATLGRQARGRQQSYERDHEVRAGGDGKNVHRLEQVGPVRLVGRNLQLAENRRRGSCGRSLTSRLFAS